MADIAERLAILIDAKTSGAVTEIKKTVKSAEDLTVSQDRASLSAAKMAAAQDKLAASLAKQQVAEAKASGDTARLAEAQSASAVATERANLSKAHAAIAADKLRVSELTAADATAALGVEATATGGMLDKLGLSAVGLGEALTALTPLLVFAVIAAGVKFLVDGVKHFEELTSQVRKFMAVTGASATQASLLVGQLKTLGVDPDAAAKSFQRLGASIGDGTTKLGDVGVAIARNKNGTVDLVATIDNLRLAYQGAADATERDAIAKQLGLRQATALLPLLNATKEQIAAINKATKASGGIVTGEDAKQGKALAIAANELKETFDHLEISLAKNFVPALAEGLDMLSKILDKTHSIVDVVANVVFAPEHLAKKLSGHDDDPREDAAKQKASSEQIAAAAQKEKDAQDQLTQSLTGELEAKRAVRDASYQLVDAQQAEVDAQSALDKLLKDGAVNAKEVTSAQKELASASRQVQHAQEAEADAQKALNDARQRASALDLAEAQNKVALAGDRIGSAKAAEQQAQEKLDALLGSGDATAGQVAAAQAELKTRHDEVTQSLLDQQQATVDLTKTQQKGTDADPAVVAAQRRLRDAHQSVQDAIENQKEALDKLHTAEAGDPDFARRVADARRDVARAHDAIRDAQLNQIESALKLKDATDKLNTSLSGTGGALLQLQAEQAILGQLNQLAARGLNVDPLLGLLSGQIETPGTDVFGQVVDNRPLIGHRAAGGPLAPGGRYLVAEPGTGGEIITMGSQGGYASPANGRGASFHVPVYVDAKNKNVGQEVAAELSWMLKTTILPRIDA